MLGAGCCSLPTPLASRALSCPLLPSPLPSQPCGVCAHWQPTHLAGPTASSGVWPWPHQGWEGLDGAVGLCRWGETEPGGAQFPRAQEPHSNAALASRTGEMARAAGDLLWSLPSVTHTPTPGRGQGQCRQCDVYLSNPTALWDPCTPLGQWQLLVSLSPGQRVGVGLAWERLLCSPGYL